MDAELPRRVGQQRIRVKPGSAAERISGGIRLAARVLTLVIGGVVGAAILAVTAPAFVGFHSVVITGGSMGPGLPLGSVAMTRTVDLASVAVGDVIVFRHTASGAAVVHRVVAIEDGEGGRLATTKGDANADNDPELLPLTGRGDRVAYHVPYLGFALVFATTRLAVILLGAAVAASVVVRVVRRGRAKANEPRAIAA